IWSLDTAKLGRNENVTTAVLRKICNAFDCDIGGIMEIIPDQLKKAKK
ncbi:MAG TPA: XRE family transcriptional regulator, partial [Lachnospiraceae bacterium]|nr:XRE family transcriptional regulator [Lachnospiraceae bacterium]